jgi:integrase
MNLTTVVELYLTTQAAENKAPATLTEYNRELRRLEEAFRDRPLNEISTFDLEVYLATRCAGMKPATRKKTLAVLSGFFTYLHDRGVIPTNPCKPIKRPSLPDPEPTYWGADEVGALLRAPLEPRNHLLLETLLRTGQRVGVVRTLRWHQVKLDVKVPHIDFAAGKNGRVHTIPLDIQLLHDFITFKRLSNPQPSDPVFRSRKGNPLSPQQVNRILAHACRLAGVRVASAHECRRTTITNLLQAGVPFDVVSRDIANHANPQTTIRHYRGVSEQRVMEALKGLPY